MSTPLPGPFMPVLEESRRTGVSSSSRRDAARAIITGISRLCLAAIYKLVTSGEQELKKSSSFFAHRDSWYCHDSCGLVRHGDHQCKGMGA